VVAVKIPGHRLLNRRAVVSALAWVGGAGAAVLVAMLALTLIGDGLGSPGTQPLAADAGPAAPYQTAASAEVPSPATSSAHPSAPPASTGVGQVSAPVTRLLSSAGGTAVARCTGDRVYLVSWSPAQGYRVDDVARGPGRYARVTFESMRREVTIQARCVDGVPTGRVYTGSHDLHTGPSPAPSPTTSPTEQHDR
jgi:hypothetical protein